MKGKSAERMRAFANAVKYHFASYDTYIRNYCGIVSGSALELKTSYKACFARKTITLSLRSCRADAKRHCVLAWVDQYLHFHRLVMVHCGLIIVSRRCIDIF